VCGFFLLQYLRKRLRKVFLGWEKAHGRNIYSDYFRIIKGFYKAKANESAINQPLLSRRDSIEQEIDIESNRKMPKEPKIKQVHEASHSMLVNHVFLDERNIAPENNLSFFRRVLIKIYGLTYLLEFVLICRFLVDIFIHCSFNLF
jgi:hypothetical protein